MRTPFIAGNWKMYKTPSEAETFAEALKKQKLPEDVRIAIIPPYVDLVPLKEKLKGTSVEVGSQNVFYEDEGAYTGEISLPMLKEIGADCVIIGHSERRQYFNETDGSCCRKLRKVLRESSLTPILCVGEKLSDREAGEQLMVVSKELRADFSGLTEDEAARVVIAYEPIWAIGTGKTATPDQAEDMCRSIRGIIRDLYSDETAESIIIQYGGSVKPENVKELMEKPDIDGALVGGASLIPEKFAAILDFKSEA
ncbi:MAG: triose-phosphate isomerase [Eubacteriales bacterium]|nr:triose-phosphate isomerase [Eubacteriales bacterium]